MRDETHAMMNTTSMRGRFVYVARAKIGGLWWNVGTFEDSANAQTNLDEHWNTPDVTKTKVDPMVVR